MDVGICLKTSFPERNSRWVTSEIPFLSCRGAELEHNKPKVMRSEVDPKFPKHDHEPDQRESRSVDYSRNVTDFVTQLAHFS